MNKSNKSYPSSKNFRTSNNFKPDNIRDDIRLVFTLLISITLHGILWTILKTEHSEDQLFFSTDLPANKRVKTYLLPVIITRKNKPIKKSKSIKKNYSKDIKTHSANNHNKNKSDSNHQIDIDYVKNNRDYVKNNRDYVKDSRDYVKDSRNNIENNFNNVVNYSKNYVPPIIISKAKPIYPDYSYQNEHEGRVILKVQINSNGTIGPVIIHTSSGHPLLDNSAKKSVTTRWRFKPAYLKNLPITSWVLLPIKFEITISH